MVPVRTAMTLHFARLPFNPKGEINGGVTCSTVRKGGKAREGAEGRQDFGSKGRRGGIMGLWLEGPHERPLEAVASTSCIPLSSRQEHSILQEDVIEVELRVYTFV